MWLVRGIDWCGQDGGFVMWCCEGPRISFAGEERVDENLVESESNCGERKV